jgi:hypothetical protein
MYWHNCLLEKLLKFQFFYIGVSLFVKENLESCPSFVSISYSPIHHNISLLSILFVGCTQFLRSFE